MLRGAGSSGAAALALLLGVALGGEARAISNVTLSGSGTYLREGGPSTFQIGAGGFVEEIEAFVALPGQALATPLSQAPAPAGLALSFSSSLSPDTTDLRLVYDLTNTGAAALAGVSFISFFDAEIDETLNTFFNEYAETSGSLAPGQAFEVDEPGFRSGDIFDNAGRAALDGTNAVGVNAPDDVSMALSFLIDLLAPGETARIEILISEDGDALGGLVIDQRDTDPRSTTSIRYSGALTIVPEPGSAFLMGAGLALLALRRSR
jgi:hypothetical protein